MACLVIKCPLVTCLHLSKLSFTHILCSPSIYYFIGVFLPDMYVKVYSLTHRAKYCAHKQGQLFLTSLAWTRCRGHSVRINGGRSPGFFMKLEAKTVILNKKLSWMLCVVKGGCISISPLIRVHKILLFPTFHESSDRKSFKTFVFLQVPHTWEQTDQLCTAHQKAETHILRLAT